MAVGDPNARECRERKLGEWLCAISMSVDESGVLATLMTQCQSLLRADWVIVGLCTASDDGIAVTHALPNRNKRRLLGRHLATTEQVVKGAISARTPLVIQNVPSAEGQTLLRRVFPRTESQLVTALAGPKRLHGLLCAGSYNAKAFSDAERETFLVLANHAALTLHSFGLGSARIHRLETSARDISKHRVQGDLVKTLSDLATHAAMSVHGAVGSIELYDDRCGKLIRSSICTSKGRRMRWSTSFDVWVPERGGRDSLGAWVFRNCRALLIDDSRREKMWKRPPWPARSGIYVPLTTDRPIGVLSVDSPYVNAFSETDLEVLLLLAARIAAKIENAWRAELMHRVAELLPDAEREPVELPPAIRRNRVLEGLTKIVWDVMRPKACSIIAPAEPVATSDHMDVPKGCERGINRKGALPLPRDKGLYSTAIESRQVQESRNVAMDPRYADKALAKRNGLASALSVPIIRDGQSYGALNYYSGFEREFSDTERYSLVTICDIAGMVISATGAFSRILNGVGTGVTLIGVPDDLQDRLRRRSQRDTDWNLDIHMPLLFLNDVQAQTYAPRAKKGMDCYKAFNNPKQRRPCSWCPTLRAMITGEPKTFYTHSPAPPKGRVEHFRVAAALVKEGDRVLGATESTAPITRELEVQNLAAKLLDVDDEAQVLSLGVECLGRGTRNDYILLASSVPSQENVKVDRIYTVDRHVLRAERQIRPEWKQNNLSNAFPPVADFFRIRDERRSWLFKEQPRHTILRRPLSRAAREAIWQALHSSSMFTPIASEKLAAFFSGTELVSREDIGRMGSVDEPRAVILRVGTRDEPIGCIVMLDTTPRGRCFEEPGHGAHWCIQVAAQLTAKIRSIRLSRSRQELAQFLRMLIDRAPVGVVRTDMAGKVLEVNRSWREMAGEDSVGHNIKDFAASEKSDFEKNIRRALQGQSIAIPQLQLHTTSGKDLIVSLRCVPLPDRPRGTGGILIGCWDMTQQKDLLARARREFAAGAVHEVRNPARAVEERVQLLSEGFVALMRMDRSSLLDALTDKEGPLLREIVQHAFEFMPPHGAPVSEAVQDGTSELKAVLTRKGVAGRNLQITQLARFGYRRMLRLFEACDRSVVKQVYNYVVTLTGVVEACNDIYYASSRVNDLINALEAQTFVSPGRRVITDLHKTIDIAITILRRKLNAAGVERTMRFSSRVPRGKWNPGQLIQLWRNIVENSIRALQKTKRSRRLVVQTGYSGGQVVVSIEDNGGGIPLGVNVSELGTGFSEREDGLHGYGLWIARHVVQCHGGELRIVRLRNRPGTRVVVSLPIHNETKRK